MSAHITELENFDCSCNACAKSVIDLRDGHMDGGPIEASMPDSASIKGKGSFSRVQSGLLIVGAAMLTGLYAGLPLVLAIQKALDSLDGSIGVACLILLCSASVLIVVLRSTSKPRTTREGRTRPNP